jgi:phenylalanyl-tRNA synthetase alpha chain
MDEKLNALEKEFEQALAAVASKESLEAAKIKFLGRKGIVAEIFKEVPLASPEQRPLLGKRLNRIKQSITQRISDKEQVFSATPVAAAGAGGFDISLPSCRRAIGTAHPLTTVIDEICALFIEMGFKVVEGPEIESEYYNFEALNIPLEHPSRESFDTFYLHKNYLLRSHTSPVQVRYIEENRPPVQIIVPGKVYRPDATDASHSFMFHQIEGLLVDQGITLAHLKGVLSVFAKKLFGAKTKTRFRPHFFPFTEPSAEMDVTCIICSGKGCRVCKQSGWLEILGSGMVHPKVLRSGAIDSKIFSGFAFGMGVERIAMLKYGVDDIRLFFENDLRFLTQFG